MYGVQSNENGSPSLTLMARMLVLLEFYCWAEVWWLLAKDVHLHTSRQLIVSRRTRTRPTSVMEVNKEEQRVVVRFLTAEGGWANHHRTPAVYGEHSMWHVRVYWNGTRDSVWGVCYWRMVLIQENAHRDGQLSYTGKSTDYCWRKTSVDIVLHQTNQD